jgi:hypothetical protein
MIKAILITFSLIAVGCFAAEPGANYELVDQDKPDNTYEGLFDNQHKDLVIETYEKTDEDAEGPEKKIVVSSLANPNQKELLFAFDRGAHAMPSPNEEWIVVNDRAIRGHCDPRLFHRVSGLKFAGVREAKVRERAIDFFVQQNKLPASIRENMIGEGDCFVEAYLWSDDSKSFLVRICKQRTGEPIWIGDWFCVYDIRSQKISLDLGALNRQAFKLTKPE